MKHLLTNILNALEVEPDELIHFSVLQHLRNVEELKNELIDAITNEKVDIKLLYHFYNSIK